MKDSSLVFKALGALLSALSPEPGRVAWRQHRGPYRPGPDLRPIRPVRTQPQLLSFRDDVGPTPERADRRGADVRLQRQSVQGDPDES